MSNVSNPFVDQRRSRSEEAAFRAERAWAEGRADDARKLFGEAAVLEEEVALEAAPSSPRVRSVLAISAVALWYKAGELDRAKRLAYTFLAGDGLTEQGRGDLEKLVDRCSREHEILRLSKDTGMVPVEVKLDGGRVGKGFAPAVAAKKRRDAVTSLLMRAAEIEANIEYRERGESDLDRDEQIQIFEVPARAASYGLRFYVASGTQQVIAPERVVTPEKVVERFLEIASAAASGPAAVRAVVPDDQYAHAFVAGFGEIAPDGNDVQTVSCSTPTWKLPNAPRQVFDPSHRSALRGAVAPPPMPRNERPGEKTFEGKLETVHLGRSESWIGLDVDGKETILMVDDRRLQAKVTPMRETDVRAFGRWVQRRGRHVLTDIVPSSSRRTIR